MLTFSLLDTTCYKICGMYSFEILFKKKKKSISFVVNVVKMTHLSQYYAS